MKEFDAFMERMDSALDDSLVHATKSKYLATALTNKISIYDKTKRESKPNPGDASIHAVKNSVSLFAC